MFDNEHIEFRTEVIGHSSSLYTMLSVKPSLLSFMSTDTFSALFPLENAVYSCPWAKTGSGR